MTSQIKDLMTLLGLGLVGGAVCYSLIRIAYNVAGLETAIVIAIMLAGGILIVVGDKPTKEIDDPRGI